MLFTRSLRVLIPVALIALGTIGWSRSQGFKPAAPNAQQQHLARLAGTWDAKVSITMGVGGTVTSTGTETNALVCGDKWLTTEFHSDLMGLPFEGHGLIGWDAAKNAFVGVWVDTMNPTLVNMEGRLKGGGLVWDYETTMMGMTNKIRDEVTWDGDDKRVLVSSFKLDAGLQEQMRIEYTRSTGGTR